VLSARMSILSKTCSTRAPTGRSSMMAGWSTSHRPRPILPD
jgi:hypothetical protein